MRIPCLSLIFTLVGAILPVFAGIPAAPLPATTAANPTATVPATTSASQPDDPLLDKLNELTSGTATLSITRNGDECTAKLTTTTARLPRLLMLLDTTDLPIRQDGMVVTTPKPGVDNLRVELKFTLNAQKAGGIPLLDCLRDITALFPAQGNSIWVVSLAADKRGTWEIDLRYNEEHFAEEFLSAMERQSQFLQPRRMDLQIYPPANFWRISFGYKVVAK